MKWPFRKVNEEVRLLPPGLTILPEGKIDPGKVIEMLRELGRKLPPSEREVVEGAIERVGRDFGKGEKSASVTDRDRR